MQVKKIIDKYCSPILEKHGFKYLGSVHTGVWEYERFEGNLTQTIRFVKSRWAKELDILITIGNIQELSFSYFITEDNGQQWWPYETEEDLKELFEKHMIAFEEKNGIQVIMDMSVPVIKATEAMHKKLLKNPAERAENFRKEYNLTYEWSIENIKKIEEILLKKREKTNIAIDEEFLLSAAAYYGELAIKNFGGTWSFYEFEDPDYDGFSCVKFYPENEVGMNSLSSIITFYSSPFYYQHKLTRKFKKLTSRLKKNPDYIAYRNSK